MSNRITNVMFIKGPSPVVDRFVAAGIKASRPVPAGASSRQWRIENWNTWWIDEAEVTIIESAHRSKLIRYSFECASDPAVGLYEAVVEQYHDLGLRLFVQWLDQYHCGILRESSEHPLHPALEPYEGDIVYSRFGEVYTEMIEHPACKSDFAA